MLYERQRGDETLSERQQIRAMRTLANLRDSSMTPTLRRIAAADGHSLNIEAIKALGRIGDGAASSALSELLSETSDSTRQALLISSPARCARSGRPQTA